MPIYAYEPTLYSEEDLSNECCYFEKLQSFRDEPLKNCPICNHPVHRAVSSFSLGGQKQSKDIYNQKNNDSPSARAAQLAMRHICRSGCQH